MTIQLMLFVLSVTVVLKCTPWMSLVSAQPSTELDIDTSSHLVQLRKRYRSRPQPSMTLMEDVFACQRNTDNLIQLNERVSVEEFQQWLADAWIERNQRLNPTQPDQPDGFRQEPSGLNLPKITCSGLQPLLEGRNGVAFAPDFGYKSKVTLFFNPAPFYGENVFPSRPNESPEDRIKRFFQGRLVWVELRRNNEEGTVTDYFSINSNFWNADVYMPRHGDVAEALNMWSTQIDTPFVFGAQRMEILFYCHHLTTDIRTFYRSNGNSVFKVRNDVQAQVHRDVMKAVDAAINAACVAKRALNYAIGGALRYMVACVATAASACVGVAQAAGHGISTAASATVNGVRDATVATVGGVSWLGSGIWNTFTYPFRKAGEWYRTRAQRSRLERQSRQLSAEH